MKIRKINYFSIIGVILISLLIGCAQTQQTQQTTQTQYVCADGKTIVTNVASCPPVPTAIQPTSAKPALSLETELETCSGMPSFEQASFEEFCIIGLAAKHNDISLCKKLSYESKRTCYLVLATVTKNVEICEEAGTEKDNCYQQYAMQNKEVSTCEKISNLNYKDSCYQNLASSLSDPMLCEKIKSAPQKDSCYFNIAINFRDTKYCDKISSESQKQNCKQNLQNSYQGGIIAQEVIPSN